MKIVFGAFLLSLLLFAGVRELLDLIPQDPKPLTAAPFIAAKHNQDSVPSSPAEGGLPHDSRPDRKDDCIAANLFPQTYQPFDATVTRVIDGDTLEVRIEGTTLSVRLWGIDAPETKQPNGPASTDYLTNLAPPQTRLSLHPVTMDRYQRLVAVTGLAQHPDDWAINVKLVAFGHAYHVDNFESEGNSCLTEAQRHARQNQAGLWRNAPNGGAKPWDYRQMQKGSPPRD